MTKLNALVTMARYWPAVGGAELHTRHLLHLLKGRVNLQVAYQHSNPDLNNERAAAISAPHSLTDGGIPTHCLGVEGKQQTILAQLASLYQHRWVRPFFHRGIRNNALKQLLPIATQAHVIHNVYNGLTGVTQASAQLAAMLEVPFVWTPLCHTQAPEGTAWSSPGFLKLYEQASALIAMTPYEKHWLMDLGVKPEKIHVCPVGPLVTPQADGLGFRKALQVDGSPIVLFLGRHTEAKGFPLVVQAMNRVWQQCPNTRFIFLGPQESTHSVDPKVFQDPRVTRMTNATEQQKNDALAGCDLLCVPSTQESLGVVYLEAWHYGKPVIAADIEVMRTVIDHNKNGLLVETSVDSVATALCKLIEQPMIARLMGKNGQKHVRSAFQWPILANRMNSIYLQVAQQHTNLSRVS